jgi:NhaP-type Na+/H+ or K+/H+ antiporter
VALFGYFICRFTRLPDIIGITAIGLIVSIVVAIIGTYNPAVASWAQQAIAGIDFSKVVFQGMLGMLLYAGSLHVNLGDITREKWVILVLATVGVVLSTAIVGTGFYLGAKLLGFEVPLMNSLLFGLIGLEVIALSLSVNQMLPVLIAIPIVLLARWVSVGVPVMAMSRSLANDAVRGSRHHLRDNT